MSDDRLRELERAVALDPTDLAAGIRLSAERGRLGIELLPSLLRNEKTLFGFLPSRSDTNLAGVRSSLPRGMTLFQNFTAFVTPSGYRMPEVRVTRVDPRPDRSDERRARRASRRAERDARQATRASSRRRR